VADHLHHIFAAIGAGLAGLALLLARKASQASPDASGRATSTSQVSDSQTAPQAPSGPQIASDGLTARAAAELVGHEAIVREAYKDGGGVWTWGIGVTDASGHTVERYIDNPQPIEHCLEIFVWLLRTKYLPTVVHAFHGAPLSEAQLAAAMSFHYNTGAIGHASWVGLWTEGQIAAARASFMTWDHPTSIVERRQKECDLFFEGTWSGNGSATVYPVLKPSYQPDFHHAERVDVLPALQTLLGA
jgi:lysozyme